MKIIRRFLLLIAVLSGLACCALAASTFTLQVCHSGIYSSSSVTEVSLSESGIPLDSDVPAYLSGGRTMVPVRVISESLGAEVNWDQDSQKVTITLDGTTIELFIGSSQATVNGSQVSLPDSVPATLVKYNGINRTMVPLRFVSEQLGHTVTWSASLYNVDIDQITASLPFVENGILSMDTGGAEPQIFQLPADETTGTCARVVIDLPGASLTRVEDRALVINDPLITRARVSCFTSDTYADKNVNYNAIQCTRLVLDLASGISMDNLSVDLIGSMLRIGLSSEEDTASWQTISDSIYDIYVTDRTVNNSDGKVIVVLDAGHGGSDPGATNQSLGVSEEDITLAVVLKLGAMLEERGITVIYTREDDSCYSSTTRTDLAHRVEIANSSNADIFVSVHVNSASASSADGIETYHWTSGDTESHELASDVQKALIAATGANGRGVKTADYTVIIHTTMPAILAEIGFISNTVECGKLVQPEYQQAIAEGLYNGIVEYLISAGSLADDSAIFSSSEE